MDKQFSKEGGGIEGTRMGWVVVRERGTKPGDESGEKVREERNVIQTATDLLVFCKVFDFTMLTIIS